MKNKQLIRLTVVCQRIKTVSAAVSVLQQVLASGGPQPESSIEFNIGDKKIGSITMEHGVIEALSLGTTMVTARAVGYDVHSKLIVYSQV